MPPKPVFILTEGKGQMAQTAYATKTNPFLRSIVRPWVIWACIALLFATGALFWLPFVYRLFGNQSLDLLHFHIVIGIVFFLIVAIQTKTGKSSIINFDFVSKENVLGLGFLTKLENSRLYRKLISVCLSLLLFSGIFLVFAQILPKFICAFFIYIHGIGSFILMGTLVLIGLRFSLQKAMSIQNTSAAEKWPDMVDPREFEIRLTPATIANTSERFIQIFSMVLKNSKLRLFLDHYHRAVDCQDIFKAKQDGQSQSPTFTSGDYIISIYQKYFTASGWAHRETLNGPILTNSHIADMSKVFYQYIPCSRCGDIDEQVSQQGLMAKFGRFLLAEMGIQPAVFQSPNPSVPITINKPLSDIVVVPAVHDYSLQTDTLQGLIAVLHAGGYTWTISNTFFDGLNYGAFFGDWFVERILKQLQDTATEFGATKIVLGGCQGISVPDTGGTITAANDFVLYAIGEGTLRFSNKSRYTKVGFCGFCDEGCHTNRSSNSIKILKTIGLPLVEIGTLGKHSMQNDEEIVRGIKIDKPDVVVAPYHNSRQRLRFLAKQNGLSVDIIGLYDFLQKVL